MKLQYLGDSKDSFKWDYHDHLVRSLAYGKLTIAWYMTPDDGGTHGSTAPELFPARPEVLQLCHDLRASRAPALLSGLTIRTGAPYVVGFHQAGDGSIAGDGEAFFKGCSAGDDEVLFLDPDNGFEPERSSSDRHVRYPDLERLLQASAPGAVITIFQHHRRKKFPEDFARIRERLISGHSCALYWHSLMFVCVSNSAEVIARVRDINRSYATGRPVMTID